MTDDALLSSSERSRFFSPALKRAGLGSLSLFNPVLLYLLTGSLLPSILAPILAGGVMISLGGREASPLRKAYLYNFLVVLSVFLHAELLFVFAFPDYVIDNLYERGPGYYFNKPRLTKLFVDKEYSVDYLTNSQGFRIGAAQSPDREISEIDWLFIGDSYTQGAQVSFEDLASSQMYSEFPDKVILNAGASGLGIAQELHLYKNWLRDLKPSVVFLQLCSFNDFMHVEPRSPGFSDYLVEYSALARFLLQDLKYRNPAELPLGRWTEPFFPDRKSNRELNIFFDESSPAKENDLRLFAKYLGDFADAVEREGAQLVVFLIPTKEQVEPVFFEEVTTAFDIDPDELDMRKPNQFMAELAGRVGVDFVDLLPTFQASTEAMFFAYDEHLTPAGHRVIAESLAQRLRRGGVSSGSVLHGDSTYGRRYPHFSRDGNLVAFQSPRDNNSELFLTDAAFGATSRVTFNDVDETHPMLSLDNSRVLFTQGDPSSFETQLMVMNRDGSNRRPILAEPGIYSAIGTFSADDSAVTFAEWSRDSESSSFTNPRIAVLSLVSGSKALLTSADHESWRPVFSPSGHQVAYISKREGQFDLFAYDLGTSRETRLTDTPFDEWDPYFSPDGSSIVYSAFVDNNWDLFELDLKEGVPTRLTATIGDEWDPSFSPSGEVIFAGRFGFFEGILSLPELRNSQ